MSWLAAFIGLRSQRLLSEWLGEGEPYVDAAGIGAEIPTRQRCTLLQLTSRTCRWPIGDPGHSDFHYCGAEPSPRRPYCPAHCVRAYRHARRGTR